MRLQQYVQKGSFYKAVVEDGSDIIFVVDYTGNIHYHNTSVHETLGYRSNSLINKNIFDYIRPETVQDLKSQFKQSQKRAYTENVEFQFLCKDLFLSIPGIQCHQFKTQGRIRRVHPRLSGYCSAKGKRSGAGPLQKAKEQFLANMSHEITNTHQWDRRDGRIC